MSSALDRYVKLILKLVNILWPISKDKLENSQWVQINHEFAFYNLNALLKYYSPINCQNIYLTLNILHERKPEDVEKGHRLTRHEIADWSSFLAGTVESPFKKDLKLQIHLHFFGRPIFRFCT